MPMKTLYNMMEMPNFAIRNNSQLLIGQLGVVDKSINAAHVNMSCNGHALRESFYLTSI